MHQANFGSGKRNGAINSSSTLTRRAPIALAAIAAAALIAPQSAHAVSDTWSGTTNSLWSLNTNWLGGNVPGSGDTATFANAGNGNLVIDLGGGVTTSTLLFTSASAAGYTIGTGGPNAQLLTLNDGGAVTVDASVGNAQTIDAGVVLGTTGGATTVTFTNNNTLQPLTFTGAINGANGAGLKTLAVAGSGSTAISGIIGDGAGGGSVGLSKSGTGSLTLSGTNAYTGGSSITGGTVIATNASSFGTGAVSVGATSTAFLDNSGQADMTFTNSFSGAGTVQVKPGGNTNVDITTLTGDLSGFTGILEVQAGNGNNGYVNLGQTTQGTTPAAASIIKINNGGSLFLNKTLAYNSSFQTAGTGNSGNLGAIRFTSNATIIGNVALQADTTVAVTANGGAIGGVISGNFGLTKKGGSTFALVNSSPNTYTGTTRIEEGTLSVGNGGFIGAAGASGLTGGDGTLGTGPTYMVGGGTLRFNRTTGSPYTYNGNINSDPNVGIINNQGTVPITLGGTNKIWNFFRVWGGGETIITGNTTVGDETSNGFNQGWTSIGIVNGGNPQPGILTINPGGSYSGMGTSDGGIPNSLIGGAITGTASINVNGGSLLFGGRQGYIIGQGNSGTQATIANLNVNSGTATFQASTITSAGSGADSTTIAVGRDGDNTVGTINLNGGTLSSARRFVRDGSDGAGAGTANFNFNGGVLRALANNTDWIASSTATYTMDIGGVPTAVTNANQKEFTATTVKIGGAKVDTNGFDVGINNVLAHDATLGVTPDGGLAKSGLGTLTLGGANTYTGPTTIDAGTAKATNVSSFASSAVTVNANGTAFLDNSGQADMTFTNSFSGAGTVQVKPGGNTNVDITTLTGDLSGFTGILEVQAGNGNNGYVNLGQTTQGTTPAAASIIKINNGGSLFLNKTLAYNSSFQTAGTGNSGNLGAIRFTSNATIIGNVALQADTTVAVTANGGAIGGVISGNFGLTKKGGSTFALVNSSPNTYTGTTRIEEGTLSVGNGGFIGAAGASGLTGGDGTLGTGPTYMVGGGTLRFNRTTGSPYTYNGNINSDPNVGIINNQGTVPITLGGTNKIWNFFRVWGGGETIITGNTTVGDETSNGFNQGWTSIGIVNGGNPQPGILTINPGGSYSGMGTSDGGIPNSLIGGAITGTASINVNGGSLLFGGRQGYIIGQGNSGTQATIANLNVNSGTATFQASTITSAGSGADSTTIAVGRDGDNTVGTINLNGGTLSSARRFVRDGSDGAGAGTANFNFNGGVLRALANNTDWIASSTATYTMDIGGVPTAVTNANQKEFTATTVKIGGAKVDTNGFNVGINNVLAHDATLGVTPDGGLAKSGLGTLTLGGANTYTGPTSVTAGKLLTVNGVQNRAAASISGNAVWEVPTTLAGGPVPLSGLTSGVTAVSSVTIPAAGANFAGTLELHNNDLVVDYSANPGTGATVYADILAKVKSGLPILGFAGANGTGIASAEVQAQTLPGTMLGVVNGGTTGGLVTSTSGYAITNPSTSVVVKYTWRGDANLDGVVNGSDYALADTGFSGGGTGWFYGDMNYDGVINGSDYALIDTGFSSQTGPLPEPATLSLLGLGAMGMLRRRRRAV